MYKMSHYRLNELLSCTRQGTTSDLAEAMHKACNNLSQMSLPIVKNQGNQSPTKQFKIKATNQSPTKQFKIKATNQSPSKQFTIKATNQSSSKKFRIKITNQSINTS
ncbi:unnamed protein product [Sphenostylis stenocarpa]|uniref:Uncharacterized protein n=1 Tax=Sphenostylis stenocarpa TaxID=92480 RepID=A0AA86S4H2_9FABA|nr:unnamed protein product [Sphenostylis stenocarpa]